MTYELTPEDRHERQIRRWRLQRAEQVRKDLNKLREAVEETDRQAEWDDARRESDEGLDV